MQYHRFLSFAIYCSTPKSEGAGHSETSVLVCQTHDIGEFPWNRTSTQDTEEFMHITDEHWLRFEVLKVLSSMRRFGMWRRLVCKIGWAGLPSWYTIRYPTTGNGFLFGLRVDCIRIRFWGFVHYPWGTEMLTPWTSLKSFTAQSLSLNWTLEW
jgi:hypothetical protein